MKHIIRRDFVLAIQPTTKGFAFVLFEGPLVPFDWGHKEVNHKQKHARTISKVQRLIDRYHPAVLVLEKPPVRRVSQAPRLSKLYLSLRHLAAAQEVMVVRYEWSVVKTCFAPVGARTKYEIAQAIALQIPAFSHRLPRIRKCWMNLDPRQALFDAAALGITYYQGVQSTETRRSQHVC